ncbi:hypothetical protein PTE30175_01365 [Pandoraea terrae]|uniref:Cytochrome c domain-containing protein n=1 Tax=Pandoraea terrae TaxID=1537710 RepID=A0A5E4TGQ6_9BURK|nr:hypothetical protein PTE30175_01365 [Pandoraea terrae]
MKTSLLHRAACLLVCALTAGAAGTANSAGAKGAGPAFNKEQALHGQTLYTENCAKCHGDKLQGMNAPALQGAAFAPPHNTSLTVGGIFTYMRTNMPADRPGQMKPEEYADVMAFLLLKNGYKPSQAALTADKAQNDTSFAMSRPVR